MPDPLSADRTAEALLWYFKEPARYHAEGRRRDAPLLDSETILKLALGRRGQFANPVLNEAGNVALLQQAAAAYVRLLFFRPEATPYETLGLAPGASPETIKESFRLLMHLVHPDRQDARGVWPDSFAAQANRAYAVLRNQDLRARFDHEAASRAAMARAINRAAAASAASTMPVVQRPKPRLGRRRFSPTRLPEWLTAGVGGYARDHPAVTAFAVFIAASLLAVITTISEGPESRLVREVQDIQEAAAPRMLAAVKAVTTAAANATGGSRAAPSSGSGVPSKQSEVTVPSTQPIAAVPAVRESAFAAPPRTDEPAVVVAENLAASRAAPMPAPLPMVTTSRPEADRGPRMREGPSETNLPVARAPPEAVVAAPRAPPPEPIAQPPFAVVAKAGPTPASVAPAALGLPPATSEIEALFATFIESYERGRVDAFAALFDDDADTDLRHGRVAIRREYDELFRLSHWRKMQLTRVNWRRTGDRAFAKGEIIVRIGWRDGREDEQRLALDMEIMRRDGRVVIAKLSHQPPKN